jgi:hypothetical protein
MILSSVIENGNAGRKGAVRAGWEAVPNGSNYFEAGRDKKVGNGDEVSSVAIV